MENIKENSQVLLIIANIAFNASILGFGVLQWFTNRVQRKINDDLENQINQLKREKEDYEDFIAMLNQRIFEIETELET